MDLQERMDVMLHQEACFYKTEDYLAPHFQQQLSTISANPFFLSSSGSHSSSKSSSSTSSINEIWREKICEWAYQVIDHFDYSREVVGVAIHYLDRYLATRSVNKKLFQLAAMTSLFLAIKLYEPGKISMASMIELSRGYFSVDQMIAMEASILRSVYMLALRTLKLHHTRRRFQEQSPRKRSPNVFAPHILFKYTFSLLSNNQSRRRRHMCGFRIGDSCLWNVRLPKYFFPQFWWNFQLEFSAASFDLVSTFLASTYHCLTQSLSFFLINTSQISFVACSSTQCLLFCKAHDFLVAAKLNCQ